MPVNSRPIPAGPGRPAWAEIDLDAVADNARALKALVGPAVELIAVVKANAYGHGAVPTAAAALAGGASRLAVACVDEGIELRRAGLTCPILVLGYTSPGDAGRVIAHGLTPTVTSRRLARALARAAERRGTVQPVQVKVDTGMGRFGLMPDAVVRYVRDLLWLPALRLEGIFTHFGCADEPEKGPTRVQLKVFERVLGELERRGIRVPLRHAANTAATLDLPETRLSAVRCGIGLLGLYPSATVARTVGLRPALQLKARVARRQRLPAGTAIGYGGTFVLERDADVALITLGYADGLPRALSNRGAVLVGGCRALIVGRISMDQTTVLVEGIPAGADEEVVIVGNQGGRTVTAEELAETAGTVHYEIISRIPPRLPRVYFRGGEPVRMQTLLGTRRLEGRKGRRGAAPMLPALGNLQPSPAELEQRP
jgi:alanine racemase